MRCGAPRGHTLYFIFYEAVRRVRDSQTAAARSDDAETILQHAAARPREAAGRGQSLAGGRRNGQRRISFAVKAQAGP